MEQRRYFIGIAILFIAISSVSQAFSWEPAQASAEKVSLNYELLEPFGPTSLVIERDSESGNISIFRMETASRQFSISKEALADFKFASLADVEIMFSGSFEDYRKADSISVCIPYGGLKRVHVDGKDMYKRAVLVIHVTAETEEVFDLKLPNYGGPNGCQYAGMEVFGF